MNRNTFLNNKNRLKIVWLLLMKSVLEALIFSHTILHEYNAIHLFWAHYSSKKKTCYKKVCEVFNVSRDIDW